MRLRACLSKVVVTQPLESPPAQTERSWSLLTWVSQIIQSVSRGLYCKNSYLPVPRRLLLRADGDCRVAELRATSDLARLRADAPKLRVVARLFRRRDLRSARSALLALRLAVVEARRREHGARGVGGLLARRDRDRSRRAFPRLRAAGTLAAARTGELRRAARALLNRKRRRHLFVAFSAWWGRARRERAGERRRADADAGRARALRRWRNAMRRGAEARAFSSWARAAASLRERDALAASRGAAAARVVRSWRRRGAAAAFRTWASRASDAAALARAVAAARRRAAATSLCRAFGRLRTYAEVNAFVGAASRGEAARLVGRVLRGSARATLASRFRAWASGAGGGGCHCAGAGGASL